MIQFEAWKRLIILIVCLVGLVAALPNVVSVPFFPGKSINLGLDLRGGSHLLLSTDIDAVVTERLSDIAEGIRISFREEKIRFKSLSSDGNLVIFSLRDESDILLREKVLSEFDDDFVVKTESGTTTIQFSDSGFLELQSRTVDQAIEIIRRRLDPDGTKEPVIQRQGVDRILVQVPGIDDPERVKALLGRTARLTFQLVDGNSLYDLTPVLAGTNSFVQNTQLPVVGLTFNLNCEPTYCEEGQWLPPYSGSNTGVNMTLLLRENLISSLK